MTAEELDIIYQIRKALGCEHVMLAELPEICRQMKNEVDDLRACCTAYRRLMDEARTFLE
jgi:hypothetical protein